MQATIGFFSFSEVTDPRAQRAYNEWHQLDHMPEQYSIPGVAHGQRWVATPACQAARAVVAPWAEGAHYLTLYLMGPPVEDTLAAFAALARTLHDRDRFFAPRRSHLSGPFDIAARTAAERVRVSPGVVPLRPHLGVYTVVEERASGIPPVDLDVLVDLPGVAGAWVFVATPSPHAAGWRPGDRRITLCYLDAPVLETAGALAALVTGPRSPFGGPVAFAGPFETITPWQWDWFDDQPGPPARP
ncbi:MAG TPA: hypothetical protein VEI83_08825 [Acidimicrobiales bacterium]|nr:hypothetical protein [Acidimicrobiales bacterium]